MKNKNQKWSTAELAWMNKILSNIPSEYKAHFKKDFGRKLIVSAKTGNAQMVLEWISGEKDTIYLSTLVVSKKDRNKGIGTDLLNLAIKLCKVCKRRELSVWSVLSESQRLWLEKKGFRYMEMMYANETLTWTDFAFDTWWEKLSAEELYTLFIQNK